MDCTAEGIDRIRVKFDHLFVFGVPYKVDFVAVFKDGAWVPYRAANREHYRAGWTGDAIYLYRQGGVSYKEPSKAAYKGAAEMCINTASAWALSNKDALLQAEVEKLSSMATKTDDNIHVLEQELLNLKHKSSEQWEAVRAFKKLHWPT